MDLRGLGKQELGEEGSSNAKPPKTSHALSVCLSLFSVLSGRERLDVASRCPSQAWRHGLDHWQGRAPSHMNCLICELLSLWEVLARG